MPPELQLKTIAHLGPGTFSEMAAIRYFGEEAVKHLGVPAPENSAIVDWVAAGMVTLGIVSIANTGGALPESIDAIYQAWERKMPVYPQASIVLPVVENIIALPGTKPDEITTVYAHPEGWKQCRNTIARYLPANPVFVPTATTAQAVERMVNDNNRSIAAIGSARAAELWGAEVIIPEANDREDDRTQFIILSNKTDHEPTGNDQTMLSFGIKNEPGSLYHALGVFAEHGINISLLSNRSQDLTVYAFFFAIFDDHARSPKGRKALEELREVADNVHVIGSYPSIDPQKDGIQ